MLTRLKTSKFSDRINSIPIKVDRMNEKINYKMRWKPTFDSTYKPETSYEHVLMSEVIGNWGKLFCLLSFH